MKHKSYIVTGPTASGKSDFAHTLAERTNGVIINCDSVQVYKGIETLSASPLAGNTGNIPYRLFSITNGDAPLSAGIWTQMARREYDDALAIGKTPIFVGGTGFYLKALTEGMSPIPAVSDVARTAARKLVTEDLTTAYEYLQKIDPVWAGKISQNDRQRITRGIEVFQATNRPLSEWQSAPRVPVITDDITKILILPDRELLRQRIADRMPELAKSVLKEVGAILEKNWSPDLPIMKADGILEISRFLSGKISFDVAIDLWRIKICNHNMKHQYTWFKANFRPDIVIDHIPTDADIERVLQ
ncbi:MAG: tRNA (adenosine(37)-N6)-dimethylallyltransferase MiaA [Alphaproteobacteria bacterium]|nr:tRNA (adenosine(37)-N6)-dimethylallyltransferase MiaA [Alphaproteobacteria bacterium]